MQDRIILGTSYSDNLGGGIGNDHIFGLDGSDNIYGGDGNDTLNGGSGGDFLFGASGSDFLVGGIGNDLLIGGLGNDLFYIAPYQGTDSIYDFTAGDKIALAPGLNFGGLTLAQNGNYTSISLGNELLANVFAYNYTLTSVDFTVLTSSPT
jgi:Ca2+-binding RTX toxin-like protein